MLLTNKQNRFESIKWPATFFRALWLAICILLSAVAFVGCRPKVDTRSGNQASEARTSLPYHAESFEGQVAKVRNQSATTIRLAQQSVEASQLELIRDLQQLDELLLDQGVVTDSSFKHLFGLHSLQHLRLRNSPLTDDAITMLSAGDFPNLRVLNLPQSAFSVAGLERLKLLPKLVQLRLGGRKIDDQACQVLSQFPKLQSLHLIGPQLSDSGLQHLANAPELATLYVDDCKLSDNAWELLLKAKPNLHVHIDQQHRDRVTSSSE